MRHELGADYRYFTFDDPLERDFARTDPNGFLAAFDDKPALLDEVQYVPELLSYIKLRIDAAPSQLGRWLLTGSQSTPSSSPRLPASRTRKRPLRQFPSWLAAMLDAP